MATTTGTHVNFVKVPTMAKFDDLTSKADGTIYFIVDAKKIYLDGVMYGFNSDDIDLTPFLNRGGGTMSGDINMNHNDLAEVSNIEFSNGARFYQENQGGGLYFYAVPGGEPLLELRDDNTIVFNTTSISGIPEPTETSSPISKGYLETNVINKIGLADGIASLDSLGKVPSTQLPSYVDDIEEYAKRADFPNTGESGKLYIDNLTGFVWRWGGTAYAQVSDGNAHLTLGITASTAYQGNLGKIAYDHSQLESGNPHKVTKDNVGLGDVENYAVAVKVHAEAGTSGTLYMTPLATKQAIDKLAPKLSWTVVA